MDASWAVFMDVSMFLFSFVFGLRESNVLKMYRSDVLLLMHEVCEISARVCKRKTSQEAIRRVTQSYRSPEPSGISPLAVLLRYYDTPSGPELLFTPTLAGSDWLKSQQ